MARPGLTQEEIEQAIAELETAAVDVTTTSVRNHLGRGSYSTISKAVAAWRTANSDREKSNVPAAPAEITALFQRLWEAAWQCACSSHESERTAFQQKSDEFTKIEKEMTNEITRLEKAVEDASSKTAACRTESNELRDRCQDLERDASHHLKLNEQLKAQVETLQHSQESLIRRNGELQSEVESQRRQTGEANKATTQLEESWRHSQSELAEARGRENAQGAEIHRLQEKAEVHVRQLEVWMDRAKSAETALQKQGKNE